MGIIADLMVRLLSDTTSLDAGFAKADRNVEAQKSKLSTITAAWSGFGAGTATAVGFLGDASRAAIEDAANTEKLRQAVENSGASWDSSSGKIDDRIKKGQSLAFTDDQTRDSLSLLVAQTGNLDEALRRQALAYDLARGSGMDLQTASKLLGKVTDDNVNVLAKYGIHVEKGASQTELFASVQAKFGGQATTYANTQQGAIDRMKDSVGEWSESIGASLGPFQGLFAIMPGVSSGMTLLGGTLGPAVAGMRALAGTTTAQRIAATLYIPIARGVALVQDLNTFALQRGYLGTLQYVGGLVLVRVQLAAMALWSGIVRGATIAWTAVQWLLNFALSANPIGLVVIAIGLLVGGFILAYRNSAAFRDTVNTLWGVLQRLGSWLQANFVGILQTVAGLMVSIATFNVAGIASGLHNLHIPGFQYGGIVPGDYQGQPRLVLAHAGEPIGRDFAGGGGAGGISIVNHFNNAMFDPREAAYEIGWEVLRLRRTRG